MNIALYDPHTPSLHSFPPVVGMTVDEFRMFSMFFGMQIPEDKGALMVGWVEPDEGDYMGVMMLGLFNDYPPADMNTHLDNIERLVKGQ